MKDLPKYSIVVPVYNEEAVLTKTFEKLRQVMDTTNESYELIFVDDGSTDRTPEILRQICCSNREVKAIAFSKNFGHQVAITAGMDNARGDAVVVIDADLQDPPEVILDMIDKWQQGYDVVYGQRAKREGETLFKRLTASMFYRLLSRLTSVDIPVDVGDFRLIDRKVCNAMSAIKERNRFVRGLVSWVGFKQTAVNYVRKERTEGTTKYPLGKMIRFAFDAIASFSHKPLKLATLLGFFVSLSGIVYLGYALYQKYFSDETVQGWTSLVTLMLIFNGITLFMLGIIGEYIARIYDESKNRPLYIISERLGFHDPTGRTGHMEGTDCSKKPAMPKQTG